MIYLIALILFFVSILVYFKIADRYNIIDHPNERSSHTQITIRGGGIIFLFAIIAATGMYPQYWLLGLAAFIIGTISFVDDRITLSSRIRMLFHLSAVTLLFVAIDAFRFPVYQCFLLYFLVVGVINAYNFMDGINGITGCYSLVILGGLQWVNIKQVAFIEADMVWLPIIACVVFLYFNFRTKARCFAGDVGSVTIAFWIMMLLLKLIFITNNWIYILFLAVYGVDSTLTIIHRLLLKQNVFKAHRFHFYQIMANEQKIPHLIVSTIYALIQLIIITVIINNQFTATAIVVITLLPLIIMYVTIKPLILKNL